MPGDCSMTADRFFLTALLQKTAPLARPACRRGGAHPLRSVGRKKGLATVFPGACDRGRPACSRQQGKIP
jgi:hypothetical protein